MPPADSLTSGQGGWENSDVQNRILYRYERYDTLTRTMSGTNEKHLTKQVVIIHLSDPHFGRKHRFNPAKTAAGDVPTRHGYPTLLQKLLEDLNQPDPKCPVLVCITGDFAEAGSQIEFKQALQFLTDLANASVFGKTLGKSSIFIVPGNHDVTFDQASPDLRLVNYGWLLNAFYGSGFASTDPSHWKLLHDDFENSGVILLSLNSSMYVEKGQPDQDRGQLDVQQLASVQKALDQIEKTRLQQAIKIALIHHHPVLIPALAEPGRGYDAVHNSGSLLTILRRFGFHMILHGHKHDPYVFSEDSRSAFRITSQSPLLIAAGGSLGSTALPNRRENCYNRISIKWHPAAGQARILIETVGLSVLDEDGNEALPDSWAWKVRRREDTHFLKGQCIPSREKASDINFQTPNDWNIEDQRPAEYARLRGNMLNVEVKPSLLPDQGYEATVWITAHGGSRSEATTPNRVEWSAGPKFKAKSVVRRSQDLRFCTTFNYWGPMLIQARLVFQDGKSECGFIYARIPEDCGDS